MLGGSYWLLGRGFWINGHGLEVYRESAEGDAEYAAQDMPAYATAFQPMFQRPRRSELLGSCGWGFVAFEKID